jgi:hypothetical protein
MGMKVVTTFNLGLLVADCVIVADSVFCAGGVAAQLPSPRAIVDTIATDNRPKSRFCIIGGIGSIDVLDLSVGNIR